MLKEVREVLKSFKHCGWVNGLQPHQYDALNNLQAAVDEFDQPKELLKFVEWVATNGFCYFENRKTWIDLSDASLITTEQLLLKYLENNKL